MMDIFKSQFSDHQVHSSLRQMLEKVENAPQQDDPVGCANIERAKKVSRFLADRLSGPAYYLIPLARLDNILKQLRATSTRFDEGLKNNENWSQFQRQLDALLEQVILLPDSADHANAIALCDAANEVREEAEGLMAGLKHQIEEDTKTLEELSQRTAQTQGQADSVSEKIAKIEAQLDGLSEQIRQQAQDLETLRQKQHQEFEAAQAERDRAFKEAQLNRNTTSAEAENERGSQFSENLSQWKSRFSETLDKHESDLRTTNDNIARVFSQRQQEQGAEFGDMLSGCRRDWSDFTDHARQDFDEKKQVLSGKSTQVVDDLQAQLDRAKQIVGIVATTGMAGHYEKVANKDLREANFFRWLAIFFFGLMLGAVGWVMYNAGSQGFNWEIGLFRLIAGLACAVPAGYCARESARHRSNEEENRRMELELAAIRPYLEPLSEDKAKEIIEKLAPEYFKGSYRTEGKDTDGKSWSTLEDIVKLIKAIKQVS